MTGGGIPVVGIAGWSGAGKTTFLEKLIAELKRRGYRVGTVKHARHEGVQFDVPGSDTWRHAKAGSDIVALAVRGGIVTFERIEGDPALEAVLGRMRDVDIILVEGYKAVRMPKIEVARADQVTQLMTPQDQLIAVVSDRRWEADVPQFSPDDAVAVADLLVSQGIL